MLLTERECAEGHSPFFGMAVRSMADIRRAGFATLALRSEGAVRPVALPSGGEHGRSGLQGAQLAHGADDEGQGGVDLGLGGEA